MLAWLLLIAVTLVTAVGPFLILADPLRQTSSTPAPLGSAGHPLGTDDLGRDEPARLVYGARPLLLVAFAATAPAAVAGTAIGLVAGYAGGFVEQILMRLVDLAVAFPSILLVILPVAAAGPGTVSLVFDIGVSLAPGLARLARALTTREAARDYVVACWLCGTSTPRILARELLPGDTAAAGRLRLHGPGGTGVPLLRAPAGRPARDAHCAVRRRPQLRRRRPARRTRSLGAA
ncbi:ABC transporter permease subunit [Streptomyces sp. NPDC050619]|uniref:ABC transporter permease n=1 Tax=Streptomyces sp. NPDC050619 TaxID=3157214 RepID=UPI0034365B62